MKILLIEASIYGHHLEYIHHIYQWMENYPQYKLQLVLPPAFKSEKNIYQWKDLKNVSIAFVPQNNIDKIVQSKGIRKLFLLTLMMRHYIKAYKPDSVFILHIYNYIPFFFIIPRYTKVYGIIYQIYLYRWEQMKWLKRIVNITHYYLMKIYPNIKGVYILNDNSAASYFNRKFHTEKFIFLPDPINDYSYKGVSLRDRMNISVSDTVFLHFGMMDERKGTIHLLNAVRLLSLESRKNKVFIFAGAIQDDIKNEFYEILESLKSESRIFVYDYFIDNEFLIDLCVTTDYIVIPYKTTDLSSGVLGYASLYGKKVIGPAGGLIGKLIRKYRLGVSINVTPMVLSKALEKVSHNESEVQSNYKQIHNVKKFCEVIFKSLSS